MSHQSSRDASPPVEAHDCLVKKKKLASQRFFISGLVSLEAEKKHLTGRRPKRDGGGDALSDSNASRPFYLDLTFNGRFLLEAVHKDRLAVPFWMNFKNTFERGGGGKGGSKIL